MARVKNTKLSSQDIREILFLSIETRLNQERIADLKGVSKNAISNVVSRKYHKDVPIPRSLPEDPSIRARSTVLSSFLRLVIAKEYFKSDVFGHETRMLAKIFNLSNYYIRRQVGKLRK